MKMQTTSPHPLAGPRKAGLRLRPRSRPVVAVILEDGTIRMLGGNRSRVTEGSHGWSNGSIFGPRWTIWWERRDLD